MNRVEKQSFLERMSVVEKPGEFPIGFPTREVVQIIIAQELMGIHEVLKGIEECQKVMVRGQHRVYPRQKVK